MTWRCSSCGHQNLGRHGVCQRCANPMDGSEQWEMPADTAAAPSVTDPALLAIAMGGSDWRCAHCDSNQRNADGSCRNCGAGKPARAPIPIRTTGCTWGCSAILGVLVMGLAGLVFAAFAVIHFAGSRPAASAPFVGLSEELEVDVVVIGGHWERRVDIERQQLVAHEGFKQDIPGDAVEVKPAGTRVHHTERVQDGWALETYTEDVPDGTRSRTVTEQVADGTDSRTRTERVRCGEDCSPGRETCREVCKPNGNGFATCRKECSRERDRCTPKWCTETKTERTPRTRTVTRTISEPAFRAVEKTRRVPVWKEVPHSAPYFTWKRLEYVLDRVDLVQGEGFDLGQAVSPARRGVTERTGTRRDRYTVTFKARDDERTWAWQTDSEAEYLSFASSGPRRLKVRDAHVLEVR
ncbi:MAG: hypothetical protein JNM69_03120 [Archangium sp.]|nr:hypothetical protein [Archangium sp.]